jgi:hypothetical protein
MLKQNKGAHIKSGTGNDISKQRYALHKLALYLFVRKSSDPRNCTGAERLNTDLRFVKTV